MPGMKLCPQAGLRKKDSAPSTAAATPGTSVAFHANPQPRAYPCPLRDLREAHLLLPHSASVTTLHVQSFTKTRSFVQINTKILAFPGSIVMHLLKHIIQFLYIELSIVYHNDIKD